MIFECFYLSETRVISAEGAENTEFGASSNYSLSHNRKALDSLFICFALSYAHLILQRA